MKVYTDPTRLKATDPGHLEGNVAFMYHDLFNANVDEVADLKERYVAGKVGDVAVKKKLVAVLNDFLDPIRTRRRHFEERPDDVLAALKQGSARANEVAEQTLAMAKKAMHQDYFARSLSLR